MASMAHRVAKGLVGGCALLLGVMVSGCAAPQYTYVANTGASTYFKVPHSWHQIGPDALSAELKTETGSSGGGWTVAYEGGAKPTADEGATDWGRHGNMAVLELDGVAEDEAIHLG